MPRVPAYYRLHDLAAVWSCSVDRLYSYLECGEITPAAVLHVRDVPNLAQPGIDGYLIVPVRYLGLEWVDDCATLQGEHEGALAHCPEAAPVAFLADGVVVRRRDLVIPESERRRFERQPITMNGTERVTLLRMVAAALTAAYGSGSLDKPYETARQLQRDLDLVGAGYSDECLAQKIVAARSVLPVATAQAA